MSTLVLLVFISLALIPVINVGTGIKHPYPIGTTGNGNVPLYISFIIHFHQPVYDVSRNICDLVSNTGSDVYETFYDREKIYTYEPLGFIDYINNNTLPVNITLDITGTLIENLENLTACASSIPGYGNYTDVADRWRSRDYSHVEIMDTSYHYDITPMIGRFHDYTALDLLRHEAWRHRKAVEDFTSTTTGFEGVRGYYPPELALDDRSLELLAEAGYNYTIVDDLHIYRMFNDYLNPYNPPEKWYANDMIDTPTDPLYLLNRSIGEWIYEELSINYGSYQHIMNPYIGLRPHYVETPGGGIVVFPRNRYFSVLMQAIMYMANDNVDQALDIFFSEINMLEHYNNDTSRPFILVMAFDGDNGDPYTHMDTWWTFLRRIIGNVTTPGSRYGYVKIVSPAWYLKHVYNPAKDNDWSLAKLLFIEPGSWNTDTTWGDPYFTKWIYPSKYSREEKMLSNITRSAAYYANSVLASPSDPRLNNSLWYLGLAMQSDWFYYPSRFALINSSLAAARSRWVSGNITDQDMRGPEILFAWSENPDNGYRPGLIYSDTRPYIKVDIWDTSAINSAILRVQAGALTRTYTLIPDPDLPGNYYAQITDDLPPGSRIELEVTAEDTSGYVAVYTYTLGMVVDSEMKLDGAVDPGSKPLWINETNTDLQFLFLNDTGPLLYVGFNTTTKGSGYDTFLFISENPSRGMVPHPWAKNGNVPSYDAYMGMEESNGWYGLWWMLSGSSGEKPVLVTNSTLLRYTWNSVGGFAELLVGKDLFMGVDRVFLGVASWGTSDGDGIHEKLRWIVSSSNLYRDEMIGVYLDEPYIRAYFTPDQGLYAINRMIEAIKSARSFIYLSIYNFNNETPDSPIWSVAEALVNASNNGVYVGVVTDDDNVAKKPIQYLIDNGVRVVTDANAPYHDKLMHVKMLVIDGVVSFYGSANLVDEAYYKIGGNYQYNDVVEVHSTWFPKPLIYEFLEMYDKGVFHGGGDPPSAFMQQRILLNNTWVQVEFYNLPDDSSRAEDALLGLIGSASSIHVMVYVITRDSIGDALVSSNSGGSDVRVIISYNEREATGSEYSKLLQNGVPTTVNLDDPAYTGRQYLHHKVFIFNSSVVASGSMNPTTSGLEYNDELLVIIHYPGLASLYEERFNTLWNRFTAHITVRVYDGDKYAINSYVSITTDNLGDLTGGVFTGITYTGYTDTNGYYHLDAYLWYPGSTTAEFIVHAELNGRSNETIVRLGLSNNTAYVKVWLTRNVTPTLIVTGPYKVNVSRPATYSIILEYPNGTIAPVDSVINIQVGSQTYTTTLSNGVGSWTHVFTSPGTYTVAFIYDGGNWISGLKLSSASTSITVRAYLTSQPVKIVIKGPSESTYGSTITYSFTLENSSSGEVLPVSTTLDVYVNGSLVDHVGIVDGTGSWTFTPSSSGVYNITIVYPGGDQYADYNLSSAVNTTILKVHRATLQVSASLPGTVYVGESFTVEVSVVNSVNHAVVQGAHVYLYINGTLYSSGYTNSSGIIDFTVIPTNEGRLNITIHVEADPDKYYPGLLRDVFVNVYRRITTGITVSAPADSYLYETLTIRVWLNGVGVGNLTLNTVLIMYINGVNTANLTIINGAGEYAFTPGKEYVGVLNITLVYPGSRMGYRLYTPAGKTILVNIRRRPVTIEPLLKVEWIKPGTVHINGTINIRDALNGSTINRGYILIYIDKYGNGKYKLIANVTISNGEATINLTADPASVKIVYTDPEAVYARGGEEGSYTILLIPPSPLPMPEPFIVSIVLLLAVYTVLYIYRRGK